MYVKKTFVNEVSCIIYSCNKPNRTKERKGLFLVLKRLNNTREHNNRNKDSCDVNFIV